MKLTDWFHKGDKTYLVMSDSHMENEKMQSILDRYEGKVDFKVHCGDIQLPFDDPLVKRFDIVVRGNHDFNAFPDHFVKDGILVVHGHIQHVYGGYEDLIELCQKEHCTVCFHGHTHIPCRIHEQGITFINPGSIFFNRGNTHSTSYALVHVGQHVRVSFYDADTNHPLSSKVLSEGKDLITYYIKLSTGGH